jgi:nicotinate dehydrogenase subunit B
MYQYNGHNPIGPQCAVADVRMDLNRATVFAYMQSIGGVAANVASLTGLPAANCRVFYYEGSSSYGSGQTAETYEAAVVVSKEIGKPVRMQWMRWDQNGWDPHGPAHLYDVKAGIDAKGKIVGTDWTSWGQATSSIDTNKELLGLATWPATPPNGGPTPSDTLYAVPARRVLAKTQPLYGGAIKNSTLRSPNAPQSYFASEQLMDELAYAANMDPIAFRRQNIDGSTIAGARWLSVLDAATIAAGWKPKVAASNLQSGNVVTGRGYGFGLYASSQVGIVADVEVNMKSGKIVAKHLYISQNNGVSISPGLISNQMSGAAIMGLSRAMHEQITFTKERVTSTDWVTYPLLRFKESPSVTLINVHPGKYTIVRPGDTTVEVREGNARAFAQGWALSGSGEPTGAAVGSAVANAFFDATGVRIRQAPMSPATIRQVLKDAGAA